MSNYLLLLIHSLYCKLDCMKCFVAQELNETLTSPKGEKQHNFKH
jgi:hypothetical protein